MSKLSNKQIKYLKGLGHHLNPLLWIGKEGCTGQVLNEMKTSLFFNELVKVKIRSDSRDDFDFIIDELQKNTAAEFVGSIGKTALFYLAADEKNEQKLKKPKIKLP